jgi:hypothetical protein
MRNAAYRLTFDDAIQVWLRRESGEFQHDIAASYRVNAGRINDILKGRLHRGSEIITKRLRGR